MWRKTENGSIDSGWKRLKVNSGKEMKRMGRLGAGRKGSGGGSRVEDCGSCHTWQTETEREKGLLRHQSQNNNNEYYHYQLRLLKEMSNCFIVVLVWHWFGFVNVHPFLYILFYIYAKSALSTHTPITQ